MNKIIHAHVGSGPYCQTGLTLQKRKIIQLIVAMKLIVLLLLFSFQVSATAYSQQLSLSVKDAPLRSVLQSIRKQTGYAFIVESADMKNARPVTISLHLVNVEDALQQIFEDQPFDYKIDGKVIVLLPKTKKTKTSETPGAPNSLNRQTMVHGTVRDEQGLAMIGVSVRIKGKEGGTVTDQQGHYSIAANTSDILTFSYIGYQPIEKTVQNSQELNITLKENIGQLNESVVKGYYSTTKLLNTGSVSTVKSDVIGKQPVSDPLAALEGNVPGLFIQQSSGVPGRAFKVLLRGQNSIANGNNPLFVVDGVPFGSNTLSSPYVPPADGNASPLNDINPSDIESIDVLKDADATAIYGSRGANGVILITTKKGKAGKTKIDVNTYTGFGKVAKKLDLMNTDEYLSMRRQAFAYDGATVSDGDYDLNGTYDPKKHTDWQKELIGGTSKVSDAQLAVSGGNAFTTFRVGGGYHYETTVLPGDFNTKRGNALVSLQHSSENGKFHLNFSSSYVTGENNIPTNNLTQYIFLSPNAPDGYTSDRKLNWANSTWTNPYATLLQTYMEKTRNLTSNAVASYEFLEGLILKTSFGYNREELDQSRLIPFSSLNPAYYPTPSSGRKNFMSDRTINTWIIEPQLSYSKKLWIGKMDFLVGTTFQDSGQELLSQQATGFSSDQLLNNFSAGSSITVLANPITQYRYNALYARVGYDIDDKYVVNFTGRRDGSSRFGPGKQFGNFWSAGAAWIFSKEKFVTDNLAFLSFGKLRGSIGSTGNDNLTDYKFLSSYSTYPYSYQGTSGLVPTQLANPLYGWEKVNKIDLGLELGFLDNKIMFNAGAYRNRTGNQLVGYSLPTITGFSNIQANLPAVIENKGLEFDLTSLNISRKNFQWTSTANITFPKNKLVSFPGLASSSYSKAYAVGQPLFVKFGYVYTGLDPTTGLYTFKDFNNDKQITSPEDIAPTFIGQKFYGSLTNNFKYKDWELSFMLYFVKQTGTNFPFVGQPGGFSPDGQSNEPRSLLTDKTIQPFSQDYGGDLANQLDLFGQSSGMISDASYIRLKNLSLAWNLPEKWRGEKGVKYAKVFFQCQNLFTITKYKGLDPENTGGYFALPPLRTMTFGFQLSL